MEDTLLETAELPIVGIETVLFDVLTVTSGQTIGYWHVYIGALALYARVSLLGYKRLLPQLQGQLAGA